MDQQRVISEFVSYFAEAKGIPLKITKWPDEENRSTKDIDAVAEGNSTRIAIEHTTIDTVPQQREDSARFKEVFGGLEAQFLSKVTDRVKVTVSFYVIQDKVSWQMLRHTLKEWIEENISTLPCGSAYYDIPGLPFKVHINKQASEKPSLRIGRFDPKDKTLPKRIADSITRKTQKLILYKERGYETFILIESDDIALMNTELMVSSVKTAIEGIKEGMKIEEIIDEIWYADTSIPNDLEFLLIWSKMN